MPTQNEANLRINVNDQGSKALVAMIRLLEQMQRTIAKTASSFKSIDKSTQDLTRTITRTADNTRKLDTSFDQMQRTLRDVRRMTDQAEGSMLDYSVALSLVADGLRRAGDFGARQIATFVQSASRLENVTQAFISILGSAEKAEEALSKLRVAAQDPGLTFEVASEAVQRFTNLGLTIDEAITVTRGFANASVLAGQSSAQLREGLRQVGQVIARGKAEQEDLNNLTERFGVIGRRARQEFGTSGEAINATLQRLGISTKDLILELSDLDKQPRAAADTLSNSISNLENALTDARNALGNEFLPIVKEAVGILTNLVEGFNDLPQPVKTATAVTVGLATGIANLGAFALDTAASIGILAVAIQGAGGLTAALVGLKAAAATAAAALAPIALVVGGIVVSVTALITAIDQLSNSFSEVVARQGGLGKITAVTRVQTEKADGATQEYVHTINLTADAMAEVAKATDMATEATTQFTDSVVDADTTFTNSVFNAPRPQPAFPIRVQPRPTTPRGIQPGAGARLPAATPGGRPPFLGAAEATQDLGLIGTQIRNHFQRVVGFAQGQIIGLRTTTRSVARVLQNASQVSAAANEKQLQSARDGIKALEAEQRAYNQQVFRTIDAFGTMSQALRNLASISEGTFSRLLRILSQVAQVSQSVVSTIQGVRSFENAPTTTDKVITGVTTAASFLNIVTGIGQLAELFHDPANDRLAELAGMRAVGSGFPIGAIRAARRQSARDFSESFGQGFERGVENLSGIGVEAPIEVTTQFVVNDKVVQEQVNTYNRLQASGRAQFRR